VHVIDIKINIIIASLMMASSSSTSPATSPEVFLGFSEPIDDPSTVLSEYLPSKIGGRPVRAPLLIYLLQACD